MGLDYVKMKIEKILADSLFKNSIYQLITNFSGLILGFIFWIVGARYYSASDIGEISVILSGILLISYISSIGLPMALIYYLPRYSQSANKMINSSLIISIILSIVLSLIAILKIDIWAPEVKMSINGFVPIFVFATSMMTVSLLISGTFTAGKRTSFRMIKENIFNSTRILGIIVFANFGAMGIFLSWSVSLVISVIIGFFLMYKLWNYTPSVSIDPIIKNMANFSIMNHISGLFYSLPGYIFPIIIINFVSKESAGYFFIAMSIASLLYGVPMAITGPFFVESCDKNKFWENIIKAIQFNMGFIIPGLLGFMIFGKFVLNIFNPTYAENSFATLIILSLVSIPMSFIGLYSTIRCTQNRVAITILINGVIAIMTLALSLFLVKKWDIEGVAIAYLVVNTIMATVIMFSIRNTIFKLKDSIVNHKNIEKSMCDD